MTHGRNAVHCDDCHTHTEALDYARRIGAGTTWRFQISRNSHGEWEVWAA